MALTPRLDPYVRLKYRFYEALVLLWILRPVNGPHIVSELNIVELGDVRKRFLKNLCYICDYRKGGDSTTAIAVEQKEDACIFWVSSNEGVRNGVTELLTDVLNELRSVANQTANPDVVTETLLVQTAHFASPRLRQETRILRNAARRCIEHLGNSDVPDEGLIAWLRRFDTTELQGLAMCRLAYQVRHDAQMRALVVHGREGEETQPLDPVIQSSRDVKHMVGRLAARVRAIHQLIDDGSLLQTILLGQYVVRGVERPSSATVPEADGHVTLRGVLKRLLPADDERYGPYLGFLSRMDPFFQIQARLAERFLPNQTNTCVHAEVQMLHHFHDAGRHFVADDRYIACSKPACICCKSYFRHHPAKVTLLSTHQKAYPNWGLVGLAQGARGPEWIDQRSTMSKVIQDLKEVVVDQISLLHASSLRHPDSLTEITASLVDGGDTSGEEEGGEEEGGEQDDE